MRKCIILLITHGGTEAVDNVFGTIGCFKRWIRIDVFTYSSHTCKDLHVCMYLAKVIVLFL